MFTLSLLEVERPKQPSAAGPTGERRVLVVKNNPKMRRFATEPLAELGNENVWVTNAEEALERLEMRDHGFNVPSGAPSGPDR